QPGANAASFVRDIVSDPNNVPDVMLLYGYLGASSEEDHERLYLSRDLTNYVEVPKAAILHQMAAPKEQDPHGAVTLWVRKEAALIYKRAPAAQALAHYFAGAIQAQAGGGAAVGAPAPIPPTVDFCATVIPVGCTRGDCTIGLCPTQAGCPTRLCTQDTACCPTWDCTRDTLCCPTHLPACPTHAVQCTQVAPCP